MEEPLHSGAPDYVYDAFSIPRFSDAQQKPPREPAPLGDIFASDLQLKLQPPDNVKLLGANGENDEPGASLLGFQQWLDLDLPPLEDLKLNEDQERSAESTQELSLPPLLNTVSQAETGFEDAWHQPDVFQPLPTPHQLLSWGTFAGREDGRSQQPKFLSEAGAEAFDAALVVRARTKGTTAGVGNAVRCHVLLRSLWQLGLGRESVLSSWDGEKRAFYPAIDDLRVSGCSLDLSQVVIEGFLSLGDRVRDLRSFTRASYDSKRPSPAKIALASAMEDSLSAMEKYFMGFAPSVHTMAQLQLTFEPLIRLTEVLQDLRRRVSSQRTDEEMLESSFGLLQTLDESGDHLRDVVQEIFKRMAQPWLSRLEEYIGLCAPAGSEIDDFGHPAFVPKGAIELIQETNRCLNFVKEQRPDHPLVRGSLLGIDNRATTFELDFSTAGLEKLQEKADRYRADVSQALELFRCKSTSGATPSSPVAFIASNPFYDGEDDDIEGLRLDEPLQIPSLDAIQQHEPFEPFDGIGNAMRSLVCPQSGEPNSEASDGNVQIPIAHALPLALLPLIHVQHDLLTRTALNLVLNPDDTTDNLSLHLQAQHAFSLFGSGAFSNRLSTVLFDTSLESAERSKARVRTGGSAGMGLKLGSGDRKQWPPASSEVQLALGSVLAPSWHDEIAHVEEEAQRSGKAQPPKPQKIGQREASLPGDLSFAIRTDLPPESIEPILDPANLHALDFLRMSYTPPASLQPIFTSRVLDHYDRIFSFWLRALRIIDALKKLTVFSRRRSLELVMSRNEVNMMIKTRQQATWLFTTTLSHIRDVGVEAPWRALTHRIQTITEAHSSDTSTNDAAKEDGQITWASLITLHEETLIDISASCFQRKRQHHLHEAWEAAAQSLLDYTAVVQEKMDDKNDQERDAVARASSDFIAKMDIFIESVADDVNDKGGKTRSSNSHGHGAVLRDLAGLLAS